MPESAEFEHKGSRYVIEFNEWATKMQEEMIAADGEKKTFHFSFGQKCLRVRAVDRLL